MCVQLEAKTQHAWTKAHFPLAGRGGRLLDKLRGLLIADHLSEVFTNVVDDYICGNRIAGQSGAVLEKSTNLVILTVRSFGQRVNTNSLSCCVLFIDFDQGIRLDCEAGGFWPE